MNGRDLPTYLIVRAGQVNMRILIADGQANVRSALRPLHCERPLLRVLATSSRPEDQVKALASGADALVNKGDPPEQLVTVERLKASRAS